MCGSHFRWATGQDFEIMHIWPLHFRLNILNVAKFALNLTSERKPKTVDKFINVQLNKYDTAPYFFILNQNMTCDCLSISVLLIEFAWSEPKIVQNIKTEQF